MPAQRVLFALAAFWALLAVPLFVTQRLSGVAIFAGPGALLHGREMLLGFLLPVIAGYLRPRLALPWLAALLAAWAAGRGTAFLGPDGLRAAADLAQAAAFAGAVVPVLLRGAKKWRNRSLPVLLGLIAALTGLFFVTGASGTGWHAGLRPVLLTALALLLLFMGGRVLVPLYRGHAKRRGLARAPGLQPRLEAGIVLACGAAALCLLAGWRPGAGACALAAGTLGLARVLRWRPWRYGDRPDLLALLAGQAWTMAALWLFGLVWLGGGSPGAGHVHVLTLGGVGTMTSMVMSLALLGRRSLGVARVWLPLAGGLMALSLAFRLAAAADPARGASWLALSAGFWSVVWLGVLALAPARPGTRGAV